MRETDDFPVVVKKGRLYLSLSVLLALAGALSSILFTRAQVNAQETRVTRVEQRLENIATKEDVDKLGDRVDAVYNVLIEKQEAHPQNRRTP